jgi:UDP-N-acetylmuramate dehydrogenase
MGIIAQYTGRSQPSLLPGLSPRKKTTSPLYYSATLVPNPVRVADKFKSQKGLLPARHRDKMRAMTSRTTDIARRLENRVGRSPETGVELRRYSNFRIGGPADYFFQASTPDELRAAIACARESRCRYFVIGGGFNLLFDDAGFRGLIIKNSCRGLDFQPQTNRLAVLGGTLLSDVTALCRERGLEGFEFLAGIPGTIGGAVYGNAGAFGRSIGEFLEEARLLVPSGEERSEVRPEDFRFAYRHSRLKETGEILLEAVFRLRPGDPIAIGSCQDAYLLLRAERHPSPQTAYAGSYFKNPPAPDGSRLAAGKLLEQVGAKELTVGGAAVFRGHGNFIYNRDGATAADVRALAAILKTRVKDRFGLDLEEEVIFLPAGTEDV